ncbi:diflavin oxidoreductase [Micromonospora radicis]|uniref:Sulfite reductase flavoprotein subunit alpha n=1 Tax=Micromonospora radicis TaxID=1894971 RepID=A0A418MUK0_9ACTN|nr:sulfite reductase flavoprotein subunit alpha [Micromonospora radicis]RIV37963.1 sulfite reductase flavoprotein subunit alpha [Micromonospora radicis]
MSIQTTDQGDQSIVAAEDSTELAVLYGSQTGNAEYLAHEIQGKASAEGHQVTVSSLDDWLRSGPRQLHRLLVVTSTHDNGHMPDNAAEFWDWLNLLGPGALNGLPYAVLSIGDSMYEDFCKAGHDIDTRLEQLGAVRVVPSIDCDVDFEFTAEKWAAPAVRELLAAAPRPAVAPMIHLLGSAEPDTTARGAERIHTARIVASRPLSAPGSAKQVMHYELAFDDGTFEYEPGDSIAVSIANSDTLVNEWLAVFDGGGLARHHDQPLRTLLKHEVELRLPHPGLIVGLARRRPDSAAILRIIALMQSGDRAQLDSWLGDRDVLDVLTDLDCLDLPIEEIVPELGRLQRRDYSISSSPLRDSGRVHITVSGVEYAGRRGTYRGAATDFLAERARDGRAFQVQRVPAHEFRLPADAVPIIMIGPGVGVAPFRAFLRHRAALGAPGRNWLFFGDQHRQLDWLYEDEFRQLTEHGLLTRLDVAFSRDQEAKRYVQHEMLANAAEIRSWIAAGAYVFVCGDKAQMAPDVDRAMAVILAGGDATESAGQQALASLKNSARYVKDVY